MKEYKLYKNVRVNMESLSALQPELLDEAVSQSRIERLPPGRNIFQEGDLDKRAVFLLAGQLALVSSERPTTTIKAGEDAASLAVADQQPREVSALATTSVTIMSIETEILEQLLSQNKEISSDNDNADEEITYEGMQRLLYSQVLRNLQEQCVQVLQTQ